YDPTLDQQVKRQQFPEGAELSVGLAFQARGPQGQPVTMWIRSIKDDDILVSPNHPMAGQQLNFRIEIVDVREATAEEKAHGHVHGPGGHAH
ncbi:MAG: peptidylprolyl isomerase, partial [Myxococcales bacterium]|nr:peptidylprolyl isomerase [Myxococcales bacterium]